MRREQGLTRFAYRYVDVCLLAAKLADARARTVRAREAERIAKAALEEAESFGKSDAVLSYLERKVLEAIRYAAACDRADEKAYVRLVSRVKQP